MIVSSEKLIFYDTEDKAIEEAKNRMRIQNSEEMHLKMNTYLENKY